MGSVGGVVEGKCKDSVWQMLCRVDHYFFEKIVLWISLDEYFDV
jgi:hypothetical protein